MDKFSILTKPFEKEDISQLPKPTKNQTEEVRADYRKGVRCNVCGGWHHPKVVHLDYVGHAATTKRLIDADPKWNWEFLSVDESGQPIFDQFGGLWVTLTVLGVTRKGYGDSGGKVGNNAIKEVIGDAIRNAAMRFGVALELWHKGEFAKTGDDIVSDEGDGGEPEESFYPQNQFDANFTSWRHKIQSGKKTSSEIIAFLEKKGARLSRDQTNQINKVGEHNNEDA